MTLNTSLVWFRRDLRAFDHAALHHALRQSQAVHCVFVYDKAILDSLPRRDRRVDFIHASLAELASELRQLGGDLISVGGFSRVPGLAPTPGEQYMVFGARSFFGYLVRDDGTVYWFANVTDRNATRDDIRGVSDDEWLRRLRVLHADDPQPVPRCQCGT